MIWYIAKRVLASLLVLLAISFVVYMLFYSSAVDPARMMCGKPCQPERLNDIRRFMQTDKSAFQQWLDFLGGLVGGRTFGEGSTSVRCSAPCFGFSFDLRQSVTSLILERFPATASIALGGATLALLFGMVGGITAAKFRGRWPDHVIRALALFFIATPTYLLGLLAILLFGFVLNMVPVSGYVPLSEDPVGWAWHLILPWLVIAVLTGSSWARFSRNQMLDELGSDHLLALRATGARPRAVARTARHGVWVPILTLFGLDIAGLLGGAIFTERVFSIKGIGTLLIDGVTNKDLGIVVGTALFGAALVIVANLVVDIVHGLIDPRVRRAGH